MGVIMIVSKKQKYKSLKNSNLNNKKCTNTRLIYIVHEQEIS